MSPVLIAPTSQWQTRAFDLDALTSGIVVELADGGWAIDIGVSSVADGALVALGDGGVAVDDTVTTGLAAIVRGTTVLVF